MDNPQFGDIGSDLLRRVMSFSDIPIGDKYSISETETYGRLDVLSPDQLVTLFEEYAEAFTNEISKSKSDGRQGYSQRAEKILTRAIEILDYLCEESFSKMTTKRALEIKDRLYLSATLNRMYHLYGRIIKCGFFPEMRNYPDGAYVAALVDLENGYPMSQAAVNNFEKQYPFLGPDTLNGTAGKIMEGPLSDTT
jgi:hypothetical protein